MLVHTEAEPPKVAGLQVPLLVASITDVDDHAAWGEPGAELLDHLLDDFVLTTGGEFQFAAIRKSHRGQNHLAFPRIEPVKCLRSLQETPQRFLPSGRTIITCEPQECRCNLIAIVGTVHRPPWVIRIRNSQTHLDELV